MSGPSHNFHLLACHFSSPVLFVLHSGTVRKVSSESITIVCKPQTFQQEECLPIWAWWTMTRLSQLSLSLSCLDSRAVKVTSMPLCARKGSWAPKDQSLSVSFFSYCVIFNNKGDCSYILTQDTWSPNLQIMSKALIWTKRVTTLDSRYLSMNVMTE